MDYQNNYNAQNDGEFGWDDVIKEESSFVLLPAVRSIGGKTATL